MPRHQGVKVARIHSRRNAIIKKVQSHSKSRSQKRSSQSVTLRRNKGGRRRVVRGGMLYTSVFNTIDQNLNIVEFVHVLEQAAFSEIAKHNVDYAPTLPSEYEFKTGESVEIGRGGFGKVYHPFPHSHDVIKQSVLHENIEHSLHHVPKHKIANFLTEVRVLAACIDGPHIVRLKGVYYTPARKALNQPSTGKGFGTIEQWDGCIKLPYISCGDKISNVSELLSPANLYAKISSTDNNALIDFKWYTIIFKIMRAVEFMHQLNIIHRDIKACNILIDANLNPTLSDFGTARYLNDTGDVYNNERKSTQRPTGTPQYMSQASRDGYVEARIDVYALVVTFCELVSKQEFSTIDYSRLEPKLRRKLLSLLEHSNDEDCEISTVDTLLRQINPIRIQDTFYGTFDDTALTYYYAYNEQTKRMYYEYVSVGKTLTSALCSIKPHKVTKISSVINGKQTIHFDSEQALVIPINDDCELTPF